MDSTLTPRDPASSRAAAVRTLRGSALALVLLSLAASGGLRAQAPTALDLDLSELINYLYTLDSGLGSYSVSGRSVRAYRIPFAYTFRSIDDHPWGLKLTLPVSLGFHDLQAVIGGDQELRESFRTLTFVPGLEFQVPAGRGWLLKPFAEAGFGKEFSTDGEWVLLYAAGTRALIERPRGRHLWSFGAALRWNGVSGLGDDPDDDYGQIEAGADFRFPLGVRLARRALDASVYVTGRRFLHDLAFERIGQEPIEIAEQVELGFTFGTEPPARLWGLELPRVGLSYRTGGGLTAYRINFGFPF